MVKFAVFLVAASMNGSQYWARSFSAVAQAIFNRPKKDSLCSSVNTEPNMYLVRLRMWTHIEQSTLSGDGTFTLLGLFFTTFFRVGNVSIIDVLRSSCISLGIFGKGFTLMSSAAEVLLFIVVWTTSTGFSDTEGSDFDSTSKLKKKSDELQSKL